MARYNRVVLLGRVAKESKNRRLDGRVFGFFPLAFGDGLKAFIDVRAWNPEKRIYRVGSLVLVDARLASPEGVGTAASTFSLIADKVLEVGSPSDIVVPAYVKSNYVPPHKRTLADGRVIDVGEYWRGASVKRVRKSQRKKSAPRGEPRTPRATDASDFRATTDEQPWDWI